MIRHLRQDDAHVHPSQCGIANCVEQRAGWNKVRARQPKPMLGILNDRQEDRSTDSPFLRRSGCHRKDDSRSLQGCGRLWGSFESKVRQRLCNVVPIFEKRHLEPRDSRTLDAHVCIPPRSELGAPPHILVTNINPANESNAAIHNHQFAMVAKIDLKPPAILPVRHKRADINPIAAQAFSPTRRQGLRPDPIVEHPALHPASGRSKQLFRK